MNAITPRGLEINTAAARPLDAIRVSRNLLLTTRVASFATLDPGGFPYNTATNLAVEADGTPVFFTAYLALHARNIEADPRASITLADHDSDVMTTPRLTLSGVLERVTGPDFEALKETYAERFPKSKLYLSLPDTLLYRLRTQAVQLNGGPAQNANKVVPQDLVTDLSGAGELMAAAAALVADLNAQGAAAGLARAAGADPAARWRVSTIDPEGINLSAPQGLARLWFANRATNPQEFAAEVAAGLTVSVQGAPA